MVARLRPKEAVEAASDYFHRTLAWEHDATVTRGYKRSRNPRAGIPVASAMPRA